MPQGQPPKGTCHMTVPDDISFAAALAICEPLFLALNDHEILLETAIIGSLRDVAVTDGSVPGDWELTDHNAAGATLFSRIVDRGNSLRRPWRRSPCEWCRGGFGFTHGPALPCTLDRACHGSGPRSFSSFHSPSSSTQSHPAAAGHNPGFCFDPARDAWG